MNDPEDYDGEINYEWKSKINDERKRQPNDCQRCGKIESVFFTYENIVRFKPRPNHSPKITNYKVCCDCHKLIENWKTINNKKCYSY